MANMRSWVTFLCALSLFLLAPWSWEQSIAARSEIANSHMTAMATDISFQRESDDSLPLSQNYRASLRKLCELLKSAESKPSLLPPELQSRKAELTASCNKLQKDDEMEKYGQVTSVAGPKLILFTVVAGVLGGIAVFRKQLKSFFQSLTYMLRRWLWSPPSSYGATNSDRSDDSKAVDGQRSVASSSMEDRQAAREARLKRFDGEAPQATL